MHEATKKRLKKAGWSTGDAGDFLELSEAESAFIDMKLGAERKDVAKAVARKRARATT